MPSLSTVAHHAIGDASDARSVPLGPDASEAIEDRRRRGAANYQMQVAQSVFRQCKAVRRWLACDCRGANDDQSPLMGVLEREGKRFLRRMQDSPLHFPRFLSIPP